MSSEHVRNALEATLTEQGKSEQYIEDFLSMFDRNHKNIEDWRAAKELLDAWDHMRKDKKAEDEIVSLRADENGKPLFHVSPKAFGWMLDM